MTFYFATGKLLKAGFDTETIGTKKIIATRLRTGHVIEILGQGGDSVGEVATIRVRRINDRDDMSSDYSAGVFCKTLSRAIRIAGD